MAYTFTKLSDVELVEASTDSNILIEENGEIKKVSSAILLSQTESAAPQKVSYDDQLCRRVWDGTSYVEEGTVSFDKFLEDFDNGVDIRVYGNELYKITSVYYDDSGRMAYYIADGYISALYF